MRKNKSSISKATSYRELAEFWDTHSLADFWDETKPVDFVVNIQSEVTYFPLASALSNQVRKKAKQQGVSPQTLINLWIQEKLQA